MQEHIEGTDVRKQQRGLQHSQDSHQDPTAITQGSSANNLSETAVLNRCTEYCSGLYNYKLRPDTSLFQSSQTPTQETESLPVLREEVEEAIHSLKAGEPSGVDKILSELLKNGGEATKTVLIVIFQKIWETKEWPNKRTKSLVVPLA